MREQLGDMVEKNTKHISALTTHLHQFEGIAEKAEAAGKSKSKIEGSISQYCWCLISCGVMY